MNRFKAWMISGVAGVFLLAVGVSAGAGLFAREASASKQSRRYSKPITVCGSDSSFYPDMGDDTCFSTCGGEIPWPFSASNQVVELSNGDRYVLMGWVNFRNGNPRFAVDLEEHPWLANSRRKLDPSYSLLGAPSYWRAYEGQKIQLRAVAKVVTAEDQGRIVLEITLQSLTDPAVVGQRE